MHPVETKLRRHIAPYLVRARGLRRQWSWRVGRFYLFGAEMLTAVGSIGVATPVIASMSRVKEGNAAEGNLLGQLLGDPLGIAGLVLLASWVVLKVVVVQNDLTSRCAAIRSCERQFRTAALSLDKALDAADPMPELVKLYNELIFPSVDRAQQDDVWPWDLSAKDGAFQAKVEEMVETLVAKFGMLWKTPENGDARSRIGDTP